MSSVAKGTMKAPQRLQPLKTFRVKRPNKVTESECVGIMQNVLSKLIEKLFVVCGILTIMFAF